MSRAASLLQLQTLDLELEAHRQRLKGIEAELGDAPAVQQAQRDLVTAEAELHAARVALQNLEFDSQLLDEKSAAVSERMYSGAVSNPKELQDLQMDLESLRRRQAALEEQQFEAMVAVESAEVRFTSLQHQLQTAEAAAARQHGALRAERDSVLAAVERLNIDREGALASIPQADRDLYSRLYASKKGRPVTRLEDGICVSCGVAASSSRVQSARQGNALVLCSNCGRILCAD